MQNEDFKTIGSIVQVKDLLIEMMIYYPDTDGTEKKCEIAELKLSKVYIKNLRSFRLFMFLLLSQTDLR